MYLICYNYFYYKYVNCVMEDFCILNNINGELKLQTPKGETIEGVIDMVITAKYNEMTVVNLTIYVQNKNTRKK